MENWTKRLNCRMEHEPMHPPISQKIHWHPDLSFRHSYTPRMQNIHGAGALVNWRSLSPLLPAFQGCASTVVKPVPQPAFVGAPLENNKASVLVKLAMLGVLKTTVAPFERVQLLMQNQNAMIKSGRLHQPYNGIFDCFARTIRNEGIFSLWRGNTANAMGHVFNKAIPFTIFQYIESREDIQWTYIRMLVAGVLVATANLFLVYPFFYAGTRLANDVKTTCNLGKRQFNGIFDVYRRTLKSDGIAGLYRGYNILLAKIGMMAALSVAVKPWQRLWLLLLQDNNLARAMVEFGFNTSRKLIFYPMDTVSRRMMMTSGEAVKYKSSLNAFAQIFKTEGVVSFYKGAGADILLNAAFKGSALLTIYLTAVLSAAMEKPRDDGSQPTSTLTIRWKNARDK
ncbi:ADP,ATP carrier protein 1, mitochondrial-like [Durio zibethinus]|uniref:ADP/ATP translocase n=1 Tax=Durio zibethinus TaxID=66656 RepID=A0A6P5WIT5_DURZI|nr:ADP,ATP carrier protein 1, mitochondrial-like [Durio zibethinus]